MVAVFAIVPVAIGSTVPVTVKVALPPGANVTVELIEPTPLGAIHELLAVAVHVQVPLNNIPGNVSFTMAFTAVDGPALVATIV